MSRQVLISVVDDDESVRESLPDLLKACGYAVQAFSSAEEFLASKVLSQTGCLVLDVQMPGMSGPDLKRELKRRGDKIPIVFITAHAEVARQADVLEGAAACLVKPFDESTLLDALGKALKSG